jgi:hypothetical protein
MPEPTPVTGLTISGHRVTNYIKRVEVREGYGTHSMAIVDVTTSAASSAYPELAPVVLDYGRSPNDIVRWYGYVHHSSVLASNSSKTVTARYVCIGTSLPLNIQRTRSWKNVSPTSIVRQVGRQNGLRTVISPSSRRLTYWAQSGQSDFKLLQDLAHEVGFRFWVEGTTLYFLDPRVLLLGQKAQNIPVFSKNQQPGVMDTIRELSILAGTMVPRQNGTTGTSSISGLDAKTGRVIKASSASNTGTSAFLNSITTARAVDNYADAQALARLAWLAHHAGHAVRNGKGYPGDACRYHRAFPFFGPYRPVDGDRNQAHHQPGQEQFRVGVHHDRRCGKGPALRGNIPERC